MIKIRNYSVGKRLGAGFGLLVATILLVVVIAIINMQFNIRRLDNVISHNNKKISYANTIDHAMHIMNDAVNSILQSNLNSQWDIETVRLLTAQAMYDNALYEIEKLEKNERGDKILYALKMLSNNIKKQIADITKLHYEGKSSIAIKQYRDEYKPSIKHIQQLCQELVAYQDEASNVEYLIALKKYKFTIYLFIAVALSTLIFTAFTSIILSKSITKPLEKAVDTAKKLSEGNFNIELNIKGNDELSRLLTAMQELSEKLKKAKETEQQLYESQKMETLGRLAGGIAHDFNNMLSIILGNAELIRLGSSTLDEKIQKRCGAIENAVARASGFVKQLLAFSKKQPLVLEKVNINKAITEFYKLIKKIIGADVELELNLATELPEVNIDISQFNQVLLNLIVNARESMPHGGTITVKTHIEDVIDKKDELKKSLYVVLSVKDTGTGIDKEIQNKIFDPFFTTKQNGTGLGLSVVYGIVNQHGGFIEFESEKGKGTTFKIYIPCPEVTVAFEKNNEKEEVEQEEITGTETILIVEDDEDIRNLINEILKAQGYKTIVTNDGQHGTEVFLQNKDKFDLVILDYMMPKKNGNDVYIDIREQRPDIPVIFLTGHNPDRIKYDPEQDKKIFIMQKPCSFELLTKKIRDMLDLRQL